jgi:hypothetical protein
VRTFIAVLLLILAGSTANIPLAVSLCVAGGVLGFTAR